MKVLWFRAEHVPTVRNRKKVLTRRWWIHPRVEFGELVSAVVGSRFARKVFARLRIEDVQELGGLAPDLGAPPLISSWCSEQQEVWDEGHPDMTPAQFESYFCRKFPRPSVRHKLYRVEFSVEKPLPAWPAKESKMGAKVPQRAPKGPKPRPSPPPPPKEKR